jgi:hypothetical protein
MIERLAEIVVLKAPLTWLCLQCVPATTALARYSSRVQHERRVFAHKAPVDGLVPGGGHHELTSSSSAAVNSTRGSDRSRRTSVTAGSAAGGWPRRRKLKGAEIEFAPGIGPFCTALCTSRGVAVVSPSARVTRPQPRGRPDSRRHCRHEAGVPSPAISPAPAGRLCRWMALVWRRRTWLRRWRITAAWMRPLQPAPVATRGPATSG